jgi:mono/diheme cytochrome c family protein
MRHTVPSLFAATLGLALLAAPSRSPAVKPPAKAVDFDRDVKPIFAKHCVSCHGPEKRRSGLRLDQKTGGDSGKAIVPGKSAESLLITLVSHDDADSRMPPKGERLTAAEIAILRTWIDQGAKWPDDGSALADPADWWSFKPLRRTAVPEIRSRNLESGMRSTDSSGRR